MAWAGRCAAGETPARDQPGRPPGRALPGRPSGETCRGDSREECWRGDPRGESCRGDPRGETCRGDTRGESCRGAPRGESGRQETGQLSATPVNRLHSELASCTHLSLSSAVFSHVCCARRLVRKMVASTIIGQAMQQRASWMICRPAEGRVLRHLAWFGLWRCICVRACFGSTAPWVEQTNHRCLNCCQCFGAVPLRIGPGVLPTGTASRGTLRVRAAVASHCADEAPPSMLLACRAQVESR